ncbi:HAMP domain-containing sensor histidine kinase [Ferrovibrio sp.]|uniref:sensor histidine kinase n=1 Tax=Ferrovibrio sp. TaxID=1917215 RepID=UPI0025BD537C|nr:HAMP domain-containing sensor histidine kinase [Ferrovibrio sp.]MBX3454574.1 HAMP domain-containing histidine kinase [Ferrovibrio sp.]
MDDTTLPPSTLSTQPATTAAAPPAHVAAPGGSLSRRLLLLTVIFVMLAEVMIYLPSVSRFRMEYFQARIELANLAILALVAAPDAMVSEELEDDLLRGVGARVVAQRHADSRALILTDRQPLSAAMDSFNLNDWHWWTAIMDAVATVSGNVQPFIRVIGSPPNNPDNVIEVVLPTAPLVQEARAFSVRIFWLSLVISGFTASLVYLSLRWLLVRPMQRLTRSIVGFRAAPEDVRQIITVSGRSDELGLAERELRSMQHDLRQALTQRGRLAQLGVAVSKISHDLRNMLASAQLVSDRLAASDDPTVRQTVPRLVDSLDRAIALCAQTLRYGKAEERPPQPEPVALYRLIEDVAAAMALHDRNDIAWKNRVPPGLLVHADPDQLYRVMMNLLRNAVQAMPPTASTGGEIRINAAELENQVAIEIADTGTGLSEAARLHLFEPFRGGAREGGTGLGLAIARELIRGHGGELELARTGPLGTTFRILLAQPDKN